ncbi:MAG: hypothetical protein ACTSXY_02065 [Promethearchaeota archaeon]
MSRAFDTIEQKILEVMNEYPNLKNNQKTLSQMIELKEEYIGKALIKLMNEGFVELEGNSFVLTDIGKKSIKEINKRKKIHSMKDVWDLHPAGGIIRDIDFVYEPINEREMVYNWAGEKGIVQLEKDIEHKWSFRIGKTVFHLKSRALNSNEIIWEVPQRDKIVDWTLDKFKAPNIIDLYKDTKFYVNIFFDTPTKAYHTLLFISALQSWFAPYMPARFFVEILGCFAGGKTTILDILLPICRHGHEMNSHSLSFLGRGMELCKATFLCDEFDKFVEKENDLLALARSSQKVGHYSRANKMGGIESYETRGSFYYTVHGEMDPAMSSRAIPIYTTKTDVKGMGKINLIKTSIGQEMLSKWFFWYMENAIEALNKMSLDKFDFTTLKKQMSDGDKSKDILVARKLLLGTIKKSVIDKELEKLVGREEELGTIISLLLNIMDLDQHPDIRKEIQNDIRELFEIKESRTEEYTETGLIGDLRYCLTRVYEKFKTHPNYRTADGEFVISNLELSRIFGDMAKKEGKLYQYTKNQFVAALRDLGFQKGKSRKKLRICTEDEYEKGEEGKSRLCNIYTKKVCLKIEIPYEKIKFDENGRPIKE